MCIRDRNKDVVSHSITRDLVIAREKRGLILYAELKVRIDGATPQSRKDDKSSDVTLFSGPPQESFGDLLLVLLPVLNSCHCSLLNTTNPSLWLWQQLKLYNINVNKFLDFVVHNVSVD